jgi:ATP phosphoribosyltransferase regulatory subunit
MKGLTANLQPDERATLELRGLFEQWGYRKYKMGRFEEFSLYLENKDFLGSDKVISFTDLDGRLLALKPDVTLSIIKNTRATRGQSEKLYYIENVYRENKENHTYKEIHQMGLEFIGDVDRYGLVEVLVLAMKSLKAISPEYLLEVSHMDYVVHFLNGLWIPEHIKLKLLRLIRNKSVSGLEKTAEKTGILGAERDLLLAIPQMYGEPKKVLAMAKNLALSSEMICSVEELEELLRILKASGSNGHIQVDFSMVNDIDYYNSLVFQGYVKELAKPVLAGGQYDLAMKRFGKDVDAIGFALYLNEINRLSSEQKEWVLDRVLLYQEADDVNEVLKQAQDWQKEGLRVWVGKRVPQGLPAKEVLHFQRKK